MNTSKGDPGPIPNRWLNCPRQANKLIVGKFMALKTPLSAKFDHLVPAECRFPPKMFFGSCKNKKLKIGLWLDLTNTNRFYDQAEIEKYGCKYVKIKCRGHGETPTQNHIKEFCKLVHTFIAQHPLETVAVHCTHGFNRTGFLIVSYLVEQMDFCLDVALQTFAEARPVGIYKQDYLAELYRMFDDMADMPPAPTLPDWCLESDDSIGNGDSYAAPSSSKGSRRNNHTTKFMTGVPGVSHFDVQPRAFHLQRKVQSMCGWKKEEFPGCQPVSMDRSNLKLLKEKPYRYSPVEQSTFNPVVQAFTENQLVPDILPQAPNALLHVEYKKSEKVVNLGNEIAPVDVREAPEVTFKANATEFYTLQFVDPDAPSRTNATKRSVNHWLVVNIPASDVSKGRTLAEYRGSGPPKDSGLHRYVFLLYRQPGNLTFDEKFISGKEFMGRPLHSAEKFAEKYKLELQAGNFYQAQYDDSVLELQKTLNIPSALAPV